MLCLLVLTGRTWVVEIDGPFTAFGFGILGFRLLTDDGPTSESFRLGKVVDLVGIEPTSSTSFSLTSNMLIFGGFGFW